MPGPTLEARDPPVPDDSGAKRCNTATRRSTTSGVNTATAAPALTISHVTDTEDVPGLVTAPTAKRLYAHLIDVLVNGLGTFTGALTGGLIGALLDEIFPWEAFAVFGIALGVIAIWVTQVYLISTTGQSLGKRWIGIRIVRTDGLPAGFVQGWLVRTLPINVLDFFLAPTVFLWVIFWTVNICMLGTTHRCMLHDRIAGTRVVMARTDASD